MCATLGGSLPSAGSGPEVAHFGLLLGRPHFRPTLAHFCYNLHTSFPAAMRFVRTWYVSFSPSRIRMEASQVAQLKQIVSALSSKPELLHTKELDFFQGLPTTGPRRLLGAKVPEPKKHHHRSTTHDHERHEHDGAWAPRARQ